MHLNPRPLRGDGRMRDLCYSTVHFHVNLTHVNCWGDTKNCNKFLFKSQIEQNFRIRECCIEMEVTHKICNQRSCETKSCKPMQQLLSAASEQQLQCRWCRGEWNGAETSGPEAVAGGVSVMVGSDGFHNAVTTATTEKHQSQNAMTTHGPEE